MGCGALGLWEGACGCSRCELEPRPAAPSTRVNDRASARAPSLCVRPDWPLHSQPGNILNASQGFLRCLQTVLCYPPLVPPCGMEGESSDHLTRELFSASESPFSLRPNAPATSLPGRFRPPGEVALCLPCRSLTPATPHQLFQEGSQDCTALERGTGSLLGGAPPLIFPHCRR